MTTDWDTPIQTFTKAVADALGMTYVQPEERTVWGRIEAGNDITLSFYGKGYGKNQHMVEVSFSTKDSHKLDPHERFHGQSINVNSNRPAEAVAKDILRRLMPIAHESAEHNAKALEARHANVSNLTERCTKLAHRYPGIRIRRDNDARHASVTLYNSGNGGAGSIEFRLSEGGAHFTIDRVSLKSWDDLHKLIDMVAG